MDKLLVLGTGAARAMHYYNTCFMLQSASGSMLVDGGGGNGILLQLERSAVPLTALNNIFLSHEHIDHSLGIIWLIRMNASLFLAGKRRETLTIRCHEELAEKIRLICSMTLSAKQFSALDSGIILAPVQDGEALSIAGHTVTFFDTHSAKAKQYGFHMESRSGQRIVCTGDEPCHPSCERYVDGADWLLHEAFCLEKDSSLFHPHAIGHGTVKEAALLAQKNNVRNLVLWHTEDSATLGRRKELYTEEARQYFHGNIFIPNDLENISLS